LSFLPSRHGFRFVNGFDRLPELNIAGLSGLPALPRAYGLCGGMSLEARGRYLNGQRISRTTTVPEPGTPLFNRLWEKQLESFGPGWRYVTQFAIWMALPDGGVGGVQRRTFDQWPSIRSQMNRNRPVVIGLVRVQATSNLKIWENHQVLAYSYSIPAATQVTILVYDPNFPREDNVRIELRRRQVGTRTVIRNWLPTQVPVYGYTAQQFGPSGEPIACRGLFAMTH
jgi:hypothetical protein